MAQKIHPTREVSSRSIFCSRLSTLTNRLKWSLRQKYGTRTFPHKQVQFVWIFWNKRTANGRPPWLLGQLYCLFKPYSALLSPMTLKMPSWPRNTRKIAKRSITTHKNGFKSTLLQRSTKLRSQNLPKWVSPKDKSKRHWWTTVGTKKKLWRNC